MLDVASKVLKKTQTSLHIEGVTYVGKAPLSLGKSGPNVASNHPKEDEVYLDRT